MKPYILLIEGDPDDLHLLRRAFAKSGITSEIVVLTDGAQACEFLFESHGAGRGYPQVILLDWTLAKVPASEVLERIRSDRRTRLIPTVVLTSGEHEADLLHLVDLVGAVRQGGLYWLAVNDSAARRT